MENNNDISKEELTKSVEHSELKQNINSSQTTPKENKKKLAKILCIIGIISLCSSFFLSFIPFLSPYLIIIGPLLITSAKVLDPNDKFINSNFKSCLTLLIIFLIVFLSFMTFCIWTCRQIPTIW